MNNPKMYAPTTRIVVEDRTSRSSRVDPSQESDGFPGVQFALIREMDVASAVCEELV